MNVILLLELALHLEQRWAHTSEQLMNVLRQQSETENINANAVISNHWGQSPQSWGLFGAVRRAQGVSSVPHSKGMVARIAVYYISITWKDTDTKWYSSSLPCHPGRWHFKKCHKKTERRTYKITECLLHISKVLLTNYGSGHGLEFRISALLLSRLVILSRTCLV